MYLHLTNLAIITDSNPAYTESDYHHLVRKSHARFMISKPHMIATVCDGAKMQDLGREDLCL